MKKDTQSLIGAGLLGLLALGLFGHSFASNQESTPPTSSMPVIINMAADGDPTLAPLLSANGSVNPIPPNATVVAKASFGGMSLFRASAYSQQAQSWWCVAASTQMMLNLITGNSDQSATDQQAYLTYGAAHSQYQVPSGVEPDGWANTLNTYGKGTYKVGIYSTFDEAIKVAATRLRLTGKPVGLMVNSGWHAWVMAGFTSTGDDPAISQNFNVTSVTVMAPDYGLSSYDPRPGSVESIAYMRHKLTGYVEYFNFKTVWDHKFILVQP